MDFDAWVPILRDFVDWAVHWGSGLGDRLIVEVYQQQRRLHPHGKIYIWSLDTPLQGYG